MTKTTLYTNYRQYFHYKRYHSLPASGDQHVIIFYNPVLSHRPPLFETMSFNNLFNLYSQSLIISPTPHYFHPPLRSRLNSFSRIATTLTDGSDIWY